MGKEAIGAVTGRSVVSDHHAAAVGAQTIALVADEGAAGDERIASHIQPITGTAGAIGREATVSDLRIVSEDRPTALAAEDANVAQGGADQRCRRIHSYVEGPDDTVGYGQKVGV